MVRCRRGDCDFSRNDRPGLGRPQGAGCLILCKDNGPGGPIPDYPEISELERLIGLRARAVRLRGIKESQPMEIIKFIVIGIGLSVAGVLVYGALRFNFEKKRNKVHVQNVYRHEKLQSTITA